MDAEALQLGGEPLDRGLRGFFEARFGRDLSAVRLHQGDRSAAYNRRLGALGFAYGHHIWLGAGQAPGRNFLLAHELAHTLQPSGSPAIRRHPDTPCPGPPMEEVSAGPPDRWTAANLAIENAYRQTHPGHAVLYGGDYLQGGNPGSAPYVTLSGPAARPWMNQALARFFGTSRRLTPDIIDFTDRTIYEIKTPSGTVPGILQLGSYYRIMNSILHDMGRPSFNQDAVGWYPGHVLPYPTNANRKVCTQETEYGLPGRRGLILYRVLEEPDQEEEEEGEEENQQPEQGPQQNHSGQGNPQPSGGNAANQGGQGAQACGATPGCPAEFCAPLPYGTATALRNASAPVLLAGIAAKVSPRVVGLWSRYLFGGSSTQLVLSSQFGADFTRSRVTAATTAYLFRAFRASLQRSPPVFPSGVRSMRVDFHSRIGRELAAINTPGHDDEMDFNLFDEIPGNIAGGIGDNQASCRVGAHPSAFDDARWITEDSYADVTLNGDGGMAVVPHLAFLVQDTIDLCPGNCGNSLELAATIPMSRMEASGVAGDVPFLVRFDAPNRPFTAFPAGDYPAIGQPGTATG
ncbi:MAG TPA: DUF4157 domain-containing protein [Fibrobacteria bacterium]|nr:DUF4157 domain-containing protein [Fibrobacteria bacterium]